CDRPCDSEETVPVTLLHPVFGKFLDDCQTYEITAKDNATIERRMRQAMPCLHDGGLTRSARHFKAMASI
ncbi:hypothetical protein PAXRUDRAFT_148231, partial [Paxillus rubicundulus Ve08.2h10]